MSSFVFQWPQMLWLLLLIIPVGFLLAVARAKRLELINAIGGGLSTHRLLRDRLRSASMVLLILALARPGHSPEIESTTRTGRDVLFALDVSRSMLAEDAVPNRLEVAKQGIRDALATFGDERVGLIVYAGSASILCPLTYDYDFIRYMLDQAHPRSVDFGGTTLQSAVEKAVDQVFIDGRGGVQDLVVLTDGGDHGSKMAKVTELLAEGEVDLLIVGIGDPEKGSPIPVEGKDGNFTLLEQDGDVIFTKLDDGALRAFSSATSHATYVAAGTRPFHLGQLYEQYAGAKSGQSANSDSGIVVYQEAALFFILPSLLMLLISECWVARGFQMGVAALCCALLTPEFDLQAADENFRADFDAAVELYQNGSFEEAVERFGDLSQTAHTDLTEAGSLAAVALNRGLALLKLSESRAEESPQVAMQFANEAQLAFLAAKRFRPNLKRAGVRLESAAQWVMELRIRIAEQEEAEATLRSEMQALLERLQALLSAQEQLRQQSLGADVERGQRRPKNTPPPPPIEMPEDATKNSLVFVQTQEQLAQEAQGIKLQMTEIHDKMSGSAQPDTPSVATVMEEPLELMDQALVSQLKAAELFVEWGGWPAARGEQQLVENAIGRILELLAGSSDRHSEESDAYDEYQDDYEYADDSEESMNSSDAIKGDFAAGAAMQELPVPNYSVEDILMEEQGNLQFRQQKRASANANKVEKDY